MRYAGLGALSAAVILLELTLTRIYSVTQGYHFAFLAVSLGLLGFGASGTALFVAPWLWRRGGHRLLGFSAILFTLTALGCYWAINQIPFDAYLLVLKPVMILYLVLFYLAPVVPFFFAGLALGGALSLEPARAGGLYGASLIGAGVGALLALAGPATAGPAGAVGLVVALGVLAWIVLTPASSVRRRALYAGIGAGLVALGWLLPQSVELRLSPYKSLPQVLRQQGSELAWTDWNAFSRVDVVKSDGLHQAPGLSFTYTESLPTQWALTVDGDNLTTLTAIAPEEARFTEYLPTALAYQLLDRPRVLVVEPGGGLDVLAALHHGAVSVVALVGNPLEVELLRGNFSEAAGQAFIDPRVEVVVRNPRGYLVRERDRFDLVVVSLRDAFRPITAGAYSLGENYLYTKEAFEAYFRHLAPDGILMVTRWTQVPPSEELRVAATMVEALEGLGVNDVHERLVAVRTLQTLTLLAKSEAFTSSEVQKVREFARTRQMDLSYLPGLDAQELNRFFVLPEEVYYSGIRRLLDPRERQRFYEEQPFDITPATDERPFFFHFFRWRQVPQVIDRLGKDWQPFGGAGFMVVLVFLGISLVVSGVLILAPLVGKRGGEAYVGIGFGQWRALVYFFALGLAFLWLELPLMQRFILLLDHATYSFGVVLFAVLVFSGIGSLLAPRLGRYRRWALPALGLMAFIYAVGIGHPLELVLGLPLAARIPAAVLILAPLALLMGVPFPSGILALQERRPALVPWAWGANGYASVVGSVVAALMALSWGFSWVMLAAGAAYLVAWAVFNPTLRAATPEAGEQI
jgi:spermidine synthase